MNSKERSSFFNSLLDLFLFNLELVSWLNFFNLVKILNRFNFITGQNNRSKTVTRKPFSVKIRLSLTNLSTNQPTLLAFLCIFCVIKFFQVLRLFHMYANFKDSYLLQSYKKSFFDMHFYF